MSTYLHWFVVYPIGLGLFLIKMSKRFTDTEKWKKPFIRSLDAAYKLLWFYMLDDCNHAGIWQVEFDIAQIRIGETIDEQKALELFNGHIENFAPGKWFIPDFIEFQYGKLNPQNRAHNAVIHILSKYNLLKNKMLISPLQGDKDKEQDKDMDKEKEKEKFAGEVLQFKTPNNADHIRAFISYWTETNKDGTMRFQMEKTWETRKRLQNWIQRAK